MNYRINFMTSNYYLASFYGWPLERYVSERFLTFSVLHFSCFQMWQHVRKPNIIAQYRFFSIKHWKMLCKFCVFWKKYVSFSTSTVLGEAKSPWLKWRHYFICPSKRSLNIFIWLQYTKGIISYGYLFMWRWDINLWLIFLHGFLLCLWWYKGVEGIIYQVIRSLVHGKHDGANFESVYHSIRKLHPF